MNLVRTSLPVSIALLLAACQQPAPPPPAAVAPTAPPTLSDADLLARGEYLVVIGGCNDCHTPGYAESAGTTPKPQWLTGTALGWNGPWGTTYAANLRLRIGEMDEATWLSYSASLKTRPPMPDFVLRAMHQEDRQAIYRFVHSLGPAGEPAPAYLPPGQKPPVPYVQWVLPPQAAAPAAAADAQVPAPAPPPAND